ncbi:ATP-binding protein [Cryptosporangium sp. NPDC048952]|uniref:ATP-binding protein n=1 Tax=Cryptosporangium sp. NPDC048952 TaxID=3363961 RepID=UPI00371F6216
MSYDVRADRQVTIVRLRGLLALRDVPTVRGVLLTCLTDCPVAVIADVSELSVSGPVVLNVFPAVQRQGEPWPNVPLLLAGVTGQLASALALTAVPEHLTVCRTLPEALARAVGPPVRGRLRFALRPTLQAAADARLATRNACTAWDLDHLESAAALVVSELVDNAAVHARTDVVVTLIYRANLLHVCVADRSSTPARRMEAVRPGRNGNGLRLVEEFASGWGTMPTPEGKLTWATLRTGLSR